MINSKYSEAISETLDILKHTEKEDIDKIPKKFLNFLEKNKSKEYISNLDHSKEISQMDLKPETIGILSIIYSKFWCEDEQERQDFDKNLRINEEKYQDILREKYNPESLFKNKKN